MTDEPTAPVSEIVEGSPDNWGRWGENDEIGALNFLNNDEVLRGIKAVNTGSCFPLGLPICHPKGDPTGPGRKTTDHHMVVDKGHFEENKRDPLTEGGCEYSDDVIYMYLQATTHIDALGHIWFDDQLYNGYEATTTKGGLSRCGIGNVGDVGVVGHGILLDMAEFFEMDYLNPGQRITLEDLQNCATAQDTEINQHDIVLIRTGWLELFYKNKDEFYSEGFNEPGITYTDRIAEWFYNKEFPVIGTDTLANEQTFSDTTGQGGTIHAALLRNQGISFHEALKLDELASSCHSEDNYEFLYVASPLKIRGASASPINPIAIV